MGPVIVPIVFIVYTNVICLDSPIRLISGVYHVLILHLGVPAIPVEAVIGVIIPKHLLYDIAILTIKHLNHIIN